MQPISAQTNVSDIVSALPQSSDLFRELRIDFCCGGKVPLSEAAAKRGLDPELVLKELKAIETSRQHYAGIRPGTLSEEELIHYIQLKHHRYLKEELPALKPYLTKVSRVHGEAHPHLNMINDLFDELKRELIDHTADEDERVFPAVISYLKEPSVEAKAIIELQLSELESEHEAAGGVLQEIRMLTNDFTPPPGACGTYRLVYQRLAELERDTHEHIHLENNILFERVKAAL
ncbi:iron-sulfur cluster repair di-iron protein [Jeotgalibacillus alimentarius]|uniref:Iron-sulfur cluster repair di-iron protein n=1 Tax=Jeotgalibacillus alimentarius TaxID=135826 RepID=A0A0C2SB95_9BACL|nr:iron-sulfur cluster repair di-iron protein [Jeotgalibacillus alimentarius]KIL51234.1 iron-sulfur cluster repair di-iron protein [Jeotgalibacillus alimentarius]